jgi:hypothetical protein
MKERTVILVAGIAACALWPAVGVSGKILSSAPALPKLERVAVLPKRNKYNAKAEANWLGTDPLKNKRKKGDVSSLHWNRGKV